MARRTKRLRRASLPTEGWIEPFQRAGGDAARPVVTRIGNLDSPREATVDARGLVTVDGAGWSLDWWVGADDRWHVPSREVAVRQRLVDDAPVVESAMRVPSGDVVQRAFAVRDGADELVVVEFENTSPVPVALALALRPYDASGAGRLERVGIDGLVIATEDGPALLAAKPPARMAGSTGARCDVADVVLAGAAGTELGSVRCDDGRATAAFVWPLAHKTTLRVAMPMGPTSRDRLPDLPAATQVANGWKVQGARGVRVVLPDDRLASAIDATRRSLLLRHDGAGATTAPGLVAEALGAWGYPEEAGERLAADPVASGLPALASHWRRHRDDALARAVVLDVEVLAERADPAGLADAADLLAAAGEERAAANARRGAGDRGAPERGDLTALLEAASPTWSWPEPDGPDLRPAARFLLAARDRLLRDDGGLALLPVVPDAWLGGGIEVHDAPTAHGTVSFAVRWQGPRPALLWELEPHAGPVTITAPGLDPTWSTTEPRGEALLAQVLPAGTPVSLGLRRK